MLLKAGNYAISVWLLQEFEKTKKAKAGRVRFAFVPSEAVHHLMLASSH